MILTVNCNIGVEKQIKIALNDFLSSVCLLSKILQGGLPLFFKKQTHRN